jgi:hypothetical protein
VKGDDGNRSIMAGGRDGLASACAERARVIEVEFCNMGLDTRTSLQPSQSLPETTPAPSKRRSVTDMGAGGEQHCRKFDSSRACPPFSMQYTGWMNPVTPVMLSASDRQKQSNSAVRDGEKLLLIKVGILAHLRDRQTSFIGSPRCLSGNRTAFRRSGDSLSGLPRCLTVRPSGCPPVWLSRLPAFRPFRFPGCLAVRLNVCLRRFVPPALPGVAEGNAFSSETSPQAWKGLSPEGRGVLAAGRPADAIHREHQVSVGKHDRHKRRRRP